MIGAARVARFAARGWLLCAVSLGVTATCSFRYLTLCGEGVPLAAQRAAASGHGAATKRPRRGGCTVEPRQAHTRIWRHGSTAIDGRRTVSLGQHWK